MSVVFMLRILCLSTGQTEHNYSKHICVADNGEKGIVTITFLCLQNKKN